MPRKPGVKFSDGDGQRRVGVAFRRHRIDHAAGREEAHVAVGVLGGEVEGAALGRAGEDEDEGVAGEGHLAGEVHGRAERGEVEADVRTGEPGDVARSGARAEDARLNVRIADGGEEHLGGESTRGDDGRHWWVHESRLARMAARAQARFGAFFGYILDSSSPDQVHNFAATESGSDFARKRTPAHDFTRQ